MVSYGRTGLEVSALCIGTSSWGPPKPGEDDQQRDRRLLTLAEKVLTERPAGINFIDTSNEYGGSRAEALIGRALAALGGPPPGLVIQTKLDRDLDTGSFSAERMWRSLEESRHRLGLETIDVLFLHDPELADFDELSGPGGAVEALRQMKERGLARWIGISGGHAPTILRYLDLGVFDTLITHNRFTLVDRSADILLNRAAELGLGVTNAAPYGGGILTGDPRFAGLYCYGPAAPEVLSSVAAMTRLCAEHDVPLGAAALQFSMREPRIHSTVVGASTVDSLQQAVEWSELSIPADLWPALEELAPAPEHWLEPPS
ncbi:hypothetical protein GCM10009841_22390 [Microlunatus panaciterrae]|uniref:D-threo-aldose 1-dehydrogenase n=1 Tax=Microlunatus panaciterrae TaxID=400768 RepID=A0ABS2REG8_9ACTN|nr:aldo/keto reductase [Microlunatus panaciterrae]MBM7797123.1 D-threo-aldose 1-dehydrogenase [Microlunatus panaciterrae]